MQHKLENKFPIIGTSYWNVVDKYLDSINMSIVEFSKKSGLDRSQVTNSINTDSRVQGKTKRKVERTLEVIIKQDVKGNFVLYDHGFAFENTDGKKFDKILMEQKFRELFKSLEFYEETFEKTSRALNMTDDEKEMIYIGLKAKLTALLEDFVKTYR